MKKDIIIKNVKSWSVAIFIMIFMITFSTIPCLFFKEWTSIIVESWNDINLLYIPDLLGAIVMVEIYILLPIIAILTIAYVIGYIIYKFYAYFFKKDRNALRDILDELVYKF